MAICAAQEDVLLQEECGGQTGDPVWHSEMMRSQEPRIILALVPGQPPLGVSPYSMPRAIPLVSFDTLPISTNFTFFIVTLLAFSQVLRHRGIVVIWHPARPKVLVSIC
jgi:hypothetical protein